jgi:hypothetical protein
MVYNIREFEAIILDLYARRVVGRAVWDRMTGDPTVSVSKMPSSSLDRP